MLGRLTVFLPRAIALLLWTPLAALAAGGGGEAIVFVADSRRYTGWEALWANIYNESHLQFAILTVLIIPVLGSILGVLTDMAMHRLGINLKSRVLAEH